MMKAEIKLQPFHQIRTIAISKKDTRMSQNTTNHDRISFLRVASVHCELITQHCTLKKLEVAINVTDTMSYETNNIFQRILKLQ